MFEREALASLERALDRRRYFLRTLPDRSRIDVTRRLTGTRTEARSWLRDQASANAGTAIAAHRRVMQELVSAAAGAVAIDAALAARVAAIDPSAPELQQAAVAIATASSADARRDAVRSSDARRHRSRVDDPAARGRDRRAARRPGRSAGRRAGAETMKPRPVRVALRAIAIAIAIAGLIDPAWTVSRPASLTLVALRMTAAPAVEVEDALRANLSGWDVRSRAVGSRLPCGAGERCVVDCRRLDRRGRPRRSDRAALADCR